MPSTLNRAALALAVALVAATAPARAQLAPEVPDQSPPSHMHAVLQKTILKVDVLTVDVCFDAATAARFASFGAGTRLTVAGADSVTRAALASKQVQARVGFLRDLSVREFLLGVHEDLRHAVKVGLLADSVLRVLEAGLPVWYAPLERRGIRKGDQIIYQLDADVIRTVFLKREGSAAVEHTERGRGLRNAPLVTWLARGAALRPELLESLRRSGARRRGAAEADQCGAR